MEEEAEVLEGLGQATPPQGKRPRGRASRSPTQLASSHLLLCSPAPSLLQAESAWQCSLLPCTEPGRGGRCPAGRGAR